MAVVVEDVEMVFARFHPSSSSVHRRLPRKLARCVVHTKELSKASKLHPVLVDPPTAVRDDCEKGFLNAINQS